MVSDLKQIETAMTMWMQSTGRTQWPHNDDGYSRIMENLVDNTSLSDHLTSLPGPPFGSTGYRYDNNNNGGNSEFTGCGDYTAAAVNIFVRDVPEEVIKKISDIVENNSELGCHKVRQYDGSDLWYMISDNQSF